VHLESLYRQTGVMPDLLADAVPEPELSAYLWAYYCHIRSGIKTKTRQALTADNVRDFCWFYGVELHWWERMALKQIDAVFMGGDL
jgi:tagatose-1,6-bisphosphate aldolase non-catalytic subunit AgaZ/GatZ